MRWLGFSGLGVGGYSSWNSAVSKFKVVVLVSTVWIWSGVKPARVLALISKCKVTSVFGSFARCTRICSYIWLTALVAPPIVK